MDAVRYFLAVLVIVSLPAAFALWPLVHGFVDTWRRLGPRVTYTVVAIIGLAIAFGMFSIRKPLLAVDFGFNPWLVPFAVLSYSIAVVIEIRCRKYLSLRILVGLPELAPENENQKLLQDGIYAELRHPRYLAFIFGVLAVALFCNYFALYLLVPILVLGIYWITVMEERELVDRFGEEYVKYQAQVPRLVPARLWPSRA